MLPCEIVSRELCCPEPVCAAEAPTKEKDQARPAARQPAEQNSNRRRTRPPSRVTRSRQQPRAPLHHLAFLERASPSHHHPRVERYSAAAAAAAAEHDPPPHEHLAALRRPGIEAAARQISKREEGEERGGGDKGLTGKELIPFLPCSPSLRASREGRRDALRMALSYGRLLPPRSRRPILAYDIHLTGLV
jgi:hypothetical protein